jgi:hypothetical protein
MNNQTLRQILAVVIVFNVVFIPLSIFCCADFVQNSTVYLQGSYDIAWSGTTSSGYRVNDHASGDFTVKGLTWNGQTVEFRYTTSDPDSITIKLKINLKDPNNCYIESYEISADYSEKAKSNAQIGIPTNISGGGGGSYDWSDAWQITVDSVWIPPLH